MPDILSITASKPTVIARTSFDYPPIPSRSMDWSAVTDNYDEGHPIGTGPDEGAALHDLMMQYADDLPKLDTDAINAIEAFHVHSLNEWLAKRNDAETPSLASFNRGHTAGYEAGFKTALAMMLELLE